MSCRLFNGLNGVKIENQGKISMLVFFNVSEEDYGNYTCVAMNKMGITNASIILYGRWSLSLSFEFNPNLHRRRSWWSRDRRIVFRRCSIEHSASI